MREQLDTFIISTFAARSGLIEERITLLLRPRPRWMPEFLWRRLAARMIRMEVEK